MNLSILAFLAATTLSASDPGDLSWPEALRARERELGATLAGPERARILRAGGAPPLAVLAAEIGRSAPSPEQRAEIAWLLVEEFVATEIDLARRMPLDPDDALELFAVRAFLLGEETIATELVDALPDDEDRPEAAVLRLAAAVSRGTVSHDLVAACAATRSRLEGRFAALAYTLDPAVAEYAASEEHRLRMSSAGYAGDDDDDEAEPVVVPAWMQTGFPPDDLVTARARFDAERCDALLQAARALPPDAPDREGQALALLFEARATNVLDPGPCFEAAVLHNARGEPALALAACDAGLRRDPASARGWRIRAAACEQLLDLRGTLLSAERALELEPADPATEERCLGALVQLGHLGEALAAGADPGVENPANPWPHVAAALDLGKRSSTDDVSDRRLARHLGHPAPRARLWSAIALAATRGTIEGGPRAVLAALAADEHDPDCAAGARAILDDDAASAWGGLAAYARGDAPEALRRWKAASRGSGDPAIAARGLFQHFDGRPGLGAATGPLTDYAAEMPPVLPDPTAVVLRLPGEAANLDVAIAVLPPGARRIVLARGRHAANAPIARGVDVLGAGPDTSLAVGALVIDARDELVRLLDLRVDGALSVQCGHVLARRVVVAREAIHGNYHGTRGPIRAHYEDATFFDQSTAFGRETHVRFERSAWRGTRGQPGTLFVYGARVELEDCALMQTSITAAPVNAHAGASVELVGCRALGQREPGAEIAPVAKASNGGRARFVRTRIVDLEPVVSDAVTAEGSTFQRTRRNAVDLDGFKATGRAPAAPPSDTVITVPGDHPTLAVALAAAPPGARVRVGPGLHPLPEALARDVEVVGAGSNRTVLQPVAPLRIQSACVTFADLCLASPDARVEAQGDTLAVPLGVTTVTNAEHAPLARVEDGALVFGTGVLVRDPRGVRFAGGPGASISGRVEMWLWNARVETAVDGNAVAALAIDREFRLWRSDGVDWDPGESTRAASALRPLALALDPHALEQVAATRALRLARVDRVLREVADRITVDELIETARRTWYLAPPDRREDEAFARLAPHLAAMAQRDARRHVEDVIAVALAGYGDENSLAETFARTRRMVRAFLDRVPAESRTYVELRLKGVDAAQADLAARKELCLQALAEDRLTEALALAEGLDSLTRASVLVVTKPETFRYDDYDQLVRDGASGELKRRLELLKKAHFGAGPTGPPILPSFYELFHAYVDAHTSGVGNRYFAFREIQGSNGWRSETVMRPEYTQTVQRTPLPPRPRFGAPRAEWDRYYDALAAWSP